MKPDLELAERFLTALFGKGAQVCFQDFWPNREEKKQAWWSYGTLDRAAADMIRRNGKGFGIYFMVNQGDGHGRSAKNVIGVRSLFVDLDGSPVQPVQDCGIPPHVITQTSEGRYQAFWRVNDVPLEKFRPLIIALADRFQGDRNIADLSRVMRLPGFFNTKRQPPFLVQILEENPGDPVTWTQMVRDLGLVLPANNPMRENPQYYDDSKPIGQGGRHKFMANTCYRLRSQGLSPEVLKSTAMAVNQERCVPPLPEKEVDMILRGTIKNVAPKDFSTRQPRYQPSGRTMQPAKLISAAELCKMDIAPTSWIIRDLLPTGLCILAGHPKVGKSWLAHSFALDIALGRRTIDVFECNKGSTLSLPLEDSLGRYQHRTRILDGTQAHGAISCIAWPRMGDGCIEHMEDWILSVEDPRLIVIDTLTKIRPKGMRRDEGVYEKDYSDMAELQNLAQKHNVAIMIIHHLRKAESDDPLGKISGSIGITGAADTILTIDRPDRMKREAVLYVSGRDISDSKHRIWWDEDRCLWRWAGFEGISSQNAQLDIAKAMAQTDRPVTAQEIAKMIHLSKQMVHTHLNVMVDSGSVEKSVMGRGRYVLAPGQKDDLIKGGYIEGDKLTNEQETMDFDGIDPEP